MSRRTALRTLALLVALAAGPAFGMFAMPNAAPVDRLIRNIEAYIREHPKDAQGYYTLGRVHYLAYTLRSQEIGAYRDGSADGNALPTISDLPMRRPRPKPGEQPQEPKPPTEAELAAHVAGAVTGFRKAIELEPNNALFHQGLAYILEQGAPLAWRLEDTGGFPPGDEHAGKAVDANRAAEARSQIGKLGDTSFEVREQAQKVLREAGWTAVSLLAAACRDANDLEARTRAEALLADYWKDRAIDTYYAAYSLAIDKDLQIRSQPLRGLNSLVGYESGRRYIQLVKARGPTQAQEQRIGGIEKALAELDKKPRGPITPIIFSLQGDKGLGELLEPGARVEFDLDGTGRRFRWPWVRPDTGILVWDPQGRGEITSGRQLFGSVTWNIFWPDGYRALDALDDDRNGLLSGGELAGLAVWFDRNGNGRSDPGEVVPIDRTPISALRTRPTGRLGGSPFCSDGLQTRAGRTLPTYDWTAEPLGQ